MGENDRILSDSRIKKQIEPSCIYPSKSCYYKGAYIVCCRLTVITIDFMFTHLSNLVFAL